MSKSKANPNIVLLNALPESDSLLAGQVAKDLKARRAEGFYDKYFKQNTKMRNEVLQRVQFAEVTWEHDGVEQSFFIGEHPLFAGLNDGVERYMDTLLALPFMKHAVPLARRAVLDRAVDLLQADIDAAQPLPKDAAALSALPANAAMRLNVPAFYHSLELLARIQNAIYAPIIIHMADPRAVAEFNDDWELASKLKILKEEIAKLPTHTKKTPHDIYAIRRPIAELLPSMINHLAASFTADGDIIRAQGKPFPLDNTSILEAAWHLCEDAATTTLTKDDFFESWTGPTEKYQYELKEAFQRSLQRSEIRRNPDLDPLQIYVPLRAAYSLHDNLYLSKGAHEPVPAATLKEERENDARADFLVGEAVPLTEVEEQAQIAHLEQERKNTVDELALHEAHQILINLPVHIVEADGHISPHSLGTLPALKPYVESLMDYGRGLLAQDFMQNASPLLKVRLLTEIMQQMMNRPPVAWNKLEQSFEPLNAENLLAMPVMHEQHRRMTQLLHALYCPILISGDIPVEAELEDPIALRMRADNALNLLQSMSPNYPAARYNKLSAPMANALREGMASAIKLMDGLQLEPSLQSNILWEMLQSAIFERDDVASFRAQFNAASPELNDWVVQMIDRNPQVLEEYASERQNYQKEHPGAPKHVVIARSTNAAGRVDKDVLPRTLN